MNAVHSVRLDPMGKVMAAGNESQWLLNQNQYIPTNVKQFKVDVEWTANDMFFMPAEYAEAHADEESAKCQLIVYVQAKNLDAIQLANDMKHKNIVLTVHDVGTNPLHSFIIPFANSTVLNGLFERAIFLHVCVPGQEGGAADFYGNFPTMEQMSDILPQVLTYFRLNHCIALGEGVGADIVCRFAMVYPDMIDGIVLVQCTSTIHGFVDNLKEIFTNWQIEDGKMNCIAWNYLALLKYGNNNKEQKDQCIARVRRMGLNEHNLSRYLYSFNYRTDFTDMLKQNLLKVDSILITGSKSPHKKHVFHMHQQMDRTRTTLMVAESAEDILNDAPEYVGQALTLMMFHSKSKSNAYSSLPSTSHSQPQPHHSLQQKQTPQTQSSTSIGIWTEYSARTPPTLSPQQKNFSAASTRTLRNFTMEMETST